MRASRWIAGAAAAIALFMAGIWAGLSGAAQNVESAATLSLTAKLVAAQEVPKPRAPAGARGTFAGGLVRTGTGGTLSWRVTFQGLSGVATASHVHLGKRGKAGNVVVPLCGPCRSGMRGTARVTAKTVTALLNGGAYVNVHTKRNPAGEIRGQVVKTAGPPPAPPASTSTGTTETVPPPTDPY